MMLRGPKNTPCQRLDRRHDGEGAFGVRTLFENEPGSPFKHVRELIVYGHSTVGSHQHMGDEELYYIIEGETLMTVDGEEEMVGPGDCILTQSGNAHSLRNVGDNMVRILIVCAHAAQPALQLLQEGESKAGTE